MGFIVANEYNALGSTPMHMSPIKWRSTTMISDYTYKEALFIKSNQIQPYFEKLLSL